MKRVVSLLITIALITSFTTLGYTQTPQAKLGRGLVNTLTGLLEIPSNELKTCKSDGAPIGLTVGLAKGIALGLYRTLVGVYEVVTFALPAPAGYEAITDPPTMLTSATLVPEDPSMRSDFRPLAEEVEGKTRERKRSVK